MIVTIFLLRIITNYENVVEVVDFSVNGDKSVQLDNSNVVKGEPVN